MSWLLFDERGERVRKLCMHVEAGTVTEGWVADDVVRQAYDIINVFGFIPERSWRPTYFAAKMAKGYRVFELDVGVHEYVDDKQVTDWWQAGKGKRLPSVAAVEMWVRHQAARDG